MCLRSTSAAHLRKLLTRGAEMGHNTAKIHRSLRGLCGSGRFPRMVARILRAIRESNAVSCDINSRIHRTMKAFRRPWKPPKNSPKVESALPCWRQLKNAQPFAPKVCAGKSDRHTGISISNPSRTLPLTIDKRNGSLLSTIEGKICQRQPICSRERSIC